MDIWILENKKIKIKIDKKKGIITALEIKDKKINILGKQTAYVAIEDCLQNKVFGPECEILSVKINKKNSAILMRKKYPKSDFISDEEIKVTSEQVNWNVSVSLKKGASRTVQIYFVIPCLKENSHLFVPYADAPFAPEQFSRSMYIYGGDMFRKELDDTVILPLITLFHPDKNYGISITQPPKLPKPQLNYFFIKEKPDLSAIIKYCYLGLQKNRQAKAEIDICSHQADWRPGLKWMLNKYPEYFKVEEPSIYKSEGTMLCSTLHSDKELKNWKKNGLTWQEIHQNIYPNFGIFVPEEKSWKPTTEVLKEKNLDLERIAQTKRCRAKNSKYSAFKLIS